MSRKLWNWSPNSVYMLHKIISQISDSFSNNSQELAATSVLKTYND